MWPTLIPRSRIHIYLCVCGDKSNEAERILALVQCDAAMNEYILKPSDIRSKAKSYKKQNQRAFLGCSAARPLVTLNMKRFMLVLGVLLEH